MSKNLFNILLTIIFGVWLSTFVDKLGAADRPNVQESGISPTIDIETVEVLRRLTELGIKIDTILDQQKKKICNQKQQPIMKHEIKKEEQSKIVSLDTAEILMKVTELEAKLDMLENINSCIKNHK